MTDEAFYLTPLDVRRMDFRTAMRGYDKEAVERFRGQVADELERLTRLNAELQRKARGVDEQLTAFRDREKALNEALVSAQQLRTEMREQMEKEAELVIREARANADRLLDAAREQVRKIEEELASLSRMRRTYLAQLRSLVERQLAEVDAAEAAEPASPAPAPSSNDAKPDATKNAKPTPAWLKTVAKE